MTLYSDILSFTIEGKIKKFSDKQKLKDFINSSPILKEILKCLPYVEKKRLQQEISIGKEKPTSKRKYIVQAEDQPLK